MVSVIIPCYNCQDLINRAVESVLSQSYQDWELILVNNNSTDQTQGRLEKYQNNYPSRVRVFQETKKGAPAARNKGLEMAKFSWIQYLDSDDELMPNKLSNQIDLLTNETIDIIAGTALVKVKKKGVVADSVRIVHDDAWLGLIRSALGITSANLYRKSLLEQVGGWKENLSSSQEYDLLFRCMQEGAIVKKDQEVNTVVYKISDSISNTTNSEKLKQIVTNRISLRMEIKHYLKSAGLLTKQLATEIDKYIYTELMSHRVLLGDYVLSEIDRLNLSISFGQKLLWQIKRLRTRI